MHGCRRGSRLLRLLGPLLVGMLSRNLKHRTDWQRIVIPIGSRRKVRNAGHIIVGRDWRTTFRISRKQERSDSTAPLLRRCRRVVIVHVLMMLMMMMRKLGACRRCDVIRGLEVKRRS